MIQAAPADQSESLTDYLIYRSEHPVRAKPSYPIQITFRSCGSCDFTKARELAKIKWPKGKSPASFHETRILAARLYAGQWVDLQAHLGYQSPAITAVYHDVRDADGLTVQFP